MRKFPLHPGMDRGEKWKGGGEGAAALGRPRMMKQVSELGWALLRTRYCVGTLRARGGVFLLEQS